MADVDIYSSQGCPFAQRTRMVLIEKDSLFNLTEIYLEHKPEWFEDISPYSKVPLIMHKGQRIYESAIINEYLDEVFPEPRLMPLDPAARAQARIWMHYCDNYYLAAAWGLRGSGGDSEKQAAALAKMQDRLRFMENEGLRKLSDSGPYWLGAELSLVDIQFSPFFERFCVYEELWGAKIPDECTRLIEWRENIKNTKGYQETARAPEVHIELRKQMMSAA